MTRIFFLLFCMSFGSSLWAQRPRAATPQYSHQYTYQYDQNYYFLDTAFNNMQYYRQWNNAYRDLFGSIVLSNVGGPRNPLTFNNEGDIWQRFHHGPYRAYFSQRENIPYYNVRTPYSEGKFWSGYDRGSIFKFTHTQNINPYWNFVAQIQRLKSLGLYTHNQNQQTKILFNTHYKKPDSGYELYFYYTFEDMEVEEFGGIQNDSVFIENQEENRILINVNLRNQDGQSDRRLMRNSEFYLDQKVRLLSLFSASDSSSSDTVNAREETGARFFIGHSTALQNMLTQYVGNAANNDFYDQFIFTRGAFNDSIHYRDFDNTVYLQAEIGRESKLQLKGGLRYLFQEYSGRDFNFSGTNLGLVSTLRGTLKDWVQVNASGELIGAGPLSGSLNLKGDGTVSLGSALKATLFYQLQRRQPELLSQFYRSNNFAWQNNFDLLTRNHIKGGLSWGEAAENSFTVANELISNYVYYNREGQPQQATGNVSYTSIALQQNFDFSSWLHSDNKVVYQVAGSGAQLYPLPELVTRNSLYANFSLFDRALLGILGFEVKYFSSYSSPSYNPATGRFFIDPEAPSIGNFPVLDVFAQFKIKKGKIFFKYEHANQGFTTRNTFAAPHYPIPDAVLRVGLMWRFFE